MRLQIADFRLQIRIADSDCGRSHDSSDADRAERRVGPGTQRRGGCHDAAFTFYSDFATNLHDALIAAGVARRATQTELFQSGSEKACFDELPAAERAAWNRAVDYYAETLPAGPFSARERVLARLELAGVVKKEALTNAAEQRRAALHAVPVCAQSLRR